MFTARERGVVDILIDDSCLLCVHIGAVCLCGALKAEGLNEVFDLVTYK